LDFLYLKNRKTPAATIAREPNTIKSIPHQGILLPFGLGLIMFSMGATN